MSDPPEDEGRVLAWLVQLAPVIDRVNCGLIGCDAESRILFVNDRLLKWTYFEREELADQPLRVLFAPELHDAVGTEFKAAEQGDLRARLSVMCRKDGTALPVLLIPEPFDDEDGRFSGIVMVVIDLGTIETAKRVSGAPTRSLTGRLGRIARELQSLSLAAQSAPGVVPLTHPDLADLTPREAEVLTHLVSGKRSPAIAQKLHISPNTVRNHLKSVFRKLGVTSQTQLIERMRSLERTTWSNKE